jgi:hypothetical protein
MAFLPYALARLIPIDGPIVSLKAIKRLRPTAEPGQSRPMTTPVEETLFTLLAAREPGKSVSPEEVARATDPDGWRRLLTQVRAVSVGLARQSKVVILRHGKPADPETLKGVYRLRLPDA